MGWTPRQLLEYLRNRAPEDFPKISHKFPTVKGAGTVVGKLVSVAVFLHSAHVTVKDERDDVVRGFFSNPDDENVQILEMSVKIEPAFDSGTCPKCGDRGEWRGLALVCRGGHGVFAG